jgi:uncharacterized low-complexity protein
MKMWIVIAVITGLLLFAGIAVVRAVSTNSGSETATTSTVSCTSCGNSCTAESNCGLASCGATQGKACTCGKR